jgi:hypothetical protein
LTMSSSAICAADILEAWRENDREQLNRRLAQDATPDLEPSRNSHECERLELLDGIAAQIRYSIASGHVQDASVYIPLLRHLAKPTAILANRNYVG